MPGKVKVKIISGKNLPVMDRSSDTTDAYVEIKLGNTTYKTDVCRRTLHPHWNTDWYRFEVDDSELQDEPLQIRLMDHDTYSANDAIGKVYLNLNPLLLPVAGQLVIGDNNPHHEISGWIPVYDTMHGIRGEVNVTVKVELFSDFNRYRQSSCGVHFFYSPTVPHGYQAKVINGFVEELIVDDDPEYQWIDKIRTPRASNEARQTLFFKLSGELQRKIGVKALNLGGNAVIGYKQSFDLEGESGIVARGIGTAVTLVKVVNVHPVVVESKEEDIQNYLNFVGDGKSFSLCSASPSHKFHFPFSHFNLFPPVDVTSLTTRVPKLTSRQHVSLDSNIPGPSLSNPNLHEMDKTSIKVLLNQEDKRGESAIARRFQKFKHSQKSLSKKMIALKAKLNDSIGEEADEDLPTISHDKRKHFKRTASDSSAMAEILARSVIHATSSLSSILENQNVPKEEDTMQKLEPIANLLIKTESQTSIIDDNASDAQSCSSSDSSSSCSDYEYRYYRKSSNDMDTISNIITNVEKLQRCLSREGLHKQYSMPSIPTKGFSLSSLDSIDNFETGDFTDYKFKREIPLNSFHSDKSKNQEESFLEDHGNNTVEKLLQLDDIEANASNTEEMASQTMVYDNNLNSTKQHMVDYTKNPTKLDYKEESQEELNMSRLTTSKENLRSEPKGIIKTALQTMLFERANILGTPEGQSVNKDSDSRNLPPPNPFIYPDKNVMLEEKPGSVVKTALQTMLMERVNLLGTPTKELSFDDVHFPTVQKSNTGRDETIKNSNELETIVQPLSPFENTSVRNSKENPLKPLLIKKGESPEPAGIVNTALQTMLFERVNILGTPKGQTVNKDLDSRNLPPPNPVIYPDKNVILEEKPGSVVKTALQTMLMERVNLLGTPTKELSYDNVNFPTAQKTNSGNDETIKTIKNSNELETIVQTLSPFENTSVRKSKDDQLKPLLIKKGDSPEPAGIVNTALQTMLFERVNILGTAADRSVKNTKLPHEIQKSAVVDYGTDSCEYRSTEDTRHLDDGQYVAIATRDEGKLPHLLPFTKTHQDVSTFSTPYTPDKTEEVKVITPVSAENISIEPKKMVKTAMQTMLLEKVSILGTYTPPTSPTLSGGNVDRKTRFPFSEDKFLGKKTSIPKSFSSASFDEHHRKRQKETVLGMPFTSLSSLTSEYEKYIKKDRINCLSDSHLHKPMIETFKEKNIAEKKRFKFLHTKTGTNSKPGGMFNKFLKHSKKNFPEEEVHKEGTKEHHQNILSRMFHVRHEEKSIKDEATQTSTDVLNQSGFPLISETNQTPNNISKNEISFPKPPSNIDVASGDFLTQSKTNLACITSNRHHSSPASDKQENNSGEKKPEHCPDAIKISHSPAKVNYMVPLHRRSSDSDLSVTPKGNSLTGSDRSVGNTAAYFMRNNYIKRGLLNQENFEMLEFPFLTMTRFCPRFIVQMGGSISARSVKLLERILNPEEPESRDIWWSEIRMEIRSHARSLNCNAVLGYTEAASICDDVCVLSASGTAAVVDLNYSFVDDDNILTVPRYAEKDKNVNGLHRTTHDSPDHRDLAMPPCRITHLPYDEKTVPVKAKVTKCPMCLKGRVPEVLIATIEPSESMPNIGKGCFIESHVSRPLKDLRGETIAKEISDGLPFLEYELHRLLVNKLKIRAMNAIFSLKIRITVGEKMLVGVATGTAMYMSSLPTPDLPMLVTDRVSDEKIVADLQEMLKETVKKNREIYQIKDDNQNSKQMSDEDSDEDHVSLDITCGNKDCCILEMDDPEDAEVLNLLMEEKIPDGFYVVSTESVPGLEDLEIVKNLQMFTQIYRAKLTPPYNLQTYFVRLLQSVYFKLRRMVPCALCDLQFRVDLPEPDEIQLCVIGMALGLGKKTKKPKPVVAQKKPEEDLMFKLDEDPFDSPPSLLSKSQPSSIKYRGHRSPSKYSRTQSILNNVRHGVDITPLSYVPGGNIEQYLGNLNFFFIRETTSIREEGGLSGFIHSFITEVLAIVRSHVTALGGNALVAFFMTECVLNHNLHKNQGQCLINVGGDVVFVSYEP